MRFPCCSHWSSLSASRSSCLAIGFPLGTHADEPSKALAVLKHRNNFNHPLLMLHLGRGANALAGFATAPNVIELGRTLAVIAGALAVFATYLLARQALPAPASLAAATATAVAPLVAMHARFFKEDIFALPFVLFSLLLLIEVLKTPTRGRALLLGLAVGLAASAKYVAALLMPFALVVLLAGLAGRNALRERLVLAGIAGAAAAAAFVLVQSPAF